MKIFYKLFFSFFTIALLIIVVLFFSQQSFERVFLENMLQMKKDFNKDFSLLEKQDTEKLSAALNVFVQDENFQNIYLEKDRDVLYQALQPLFQELKKSYGITHFYFILPDGKCFLRVHDKDIYGDDITRFTFWKARDTKQLVSGLELGKTAFALRVVTPYYRNNELIGYVELGEEIDHFLEMLKGSSDNEFFLLIKKQYLDKKKYDLVKKRAMARNNWDDFNDYVIVGSTKDSSDFRELFSKTTVVEGEENYSDSYSVIKDGDDEYVVDSFGFVDAGDRKAGMIISMIEISDFIGHAQENMQRLIIIGIFIFIIAMFFCFYVSFSISGPIEKLRDAVFVIGSGDFSKKVNIRSNDEVGQLSHAINKMSEQLQGSYRDLEAKVAKKTEELSQTLFRSQKDNKALEETKMAILNILDDLEESKKRLEDERNKLTALKNDLERSNKELEQFAYVASHDLQEPIRMVASYTQLLERQYNELLDDKGRKYIFFATDGAKRMQQLIDDLLAFSRVGTKGKEFAAVDSAKVCKEVINNLDIAIKESDSDIVFDNLPVVYGDDVQLLQLFQNLIGNAIKYRGDRKPKIRIGVQDKGKEWLFSISDNGIGIDEKYKERIFVIFQRLHTKKEYKGTGIGLAICKKIVERHGGRIWIESKPEQGTTFYFTLSKERKRKLGEMLVEDGFISAEDLKAELKKQGDEV
ncbi:MAG: ATP-binding protein [Candidatus Omnitrophica bacterium]|nr:ATP-binding protein [Candidatus Omnitrophota bacterium]